MEKTPLDYLAARAQLYPNVEKIQRGSPEDEAILRLMKRSGYKSIEDIIMAEMPPPPLFDWKTRVQPINRVMPILNIPAMSKTAWLGDLDNRKAYHEHLQKK